MRATEEMQIADIIEAAEEVTDPLDNLVERTADDPGIPFQPDVLASLCELKRQDQAAFERLRARLRKTGCRVTELDDAIAKEIGESDRGPKQADILINLTADIDLFHDATDTGFADLEINGHRETWPLRSKGFKRWIARRYFEETGSAPNSEALYSALNVIEARAHFDAPQRDVFIRVAGQGGKHYLDLADDTWRAVEIDRGGWRLVERPPVRFRRSSGMQPLPAPKPGGSIELLRPFLNVSDDDFILVVAWALAVLRDRGPYPVIALSGEQGSAKSTFSAILRALLDPNAAPLRALPRNDHDLHIAASNGHLLAFDNVSRLPAWLSDTLCRLATGGGFAVRQLYTDQDEVLFDATRPVILNGIEEIVTRADLADRAIFLTLEPIPEERRRPEAELWTEFDDVCPKILGALLDAVSTGLRRLPEIRLEGLPRLADFALWATACEGALWPTGTFMAAYSGNRDEAVESVIESDSVAAAVRALMAERTEWTGTATELLNTLSAKVDERVANGRSWPAVPQTLSNRLRRAATSLRQVGINITFYKEGSSRKRMIRISREPDGVGTLPSRPSAPSAPTARGVPDKGLEAAPGRTVAPPPDANGGLLGGSTVRGEARDLPLADAADGTDAKLYEQSGNWNGFPIGGSGVDLELEEDPEPASDLLDGSRPHEVVASPVADHLPWTEEDWQEFFGERAGIIEFDGGQSREQAEAAAFECCVTEWLSHHPVASTPERCLECNQPEHTHDRLALFGTEATGHAWLHNHCWSSWHAGRKADAATALVALGIEEGGDHV